MQVSAGLRAIHAADVLGTVPEARGIGTAAVGERGTIGWSLGWHLTKPRVTCRAAPLSSVRNRLICPYPHVRAGDNIYLYGGRRRDICRP